MRFSVLGPVAVFDDGLPLALGGWKQRAVLALLALTPTRMVSPDRLITDIWGDDADRGARDTLYTYISNLRAVLGKDRIQRGPAGYRLVAATEELDADQFEAFTDEAFRLVGTAPDEAMRRFEAALGLWRGSAFEGHEDLPSIEPEATRLNELRISAQEGRFEAMLRTSDPPTPAEVELLHKDNPFREASCSLLMRSQYRAGRQAEALRTYQDYRRALGEELGIEPSPGLARLEEQILLQDPVLDAAPEHPSNLPLPVTSFVGRLDEQANLDEAIHRHRLVTILGPGGAGKTRLAIETARTLIGGYPDGVWLIDLARVAGPEEVSEALAATLGVASEDEPSDEATLTWLAGRTLLLLLDNCEHVRDEAGRLALAIVERAGDVRVLATSRIALNQRGEHRFQLLGLETGTEALDLFTDRAQAVGASVAELDVDSIDKLCQRLEGLPLAIELAASRTNIMSVDEINERLTGSFELLAGEHPTRDIHTSLESAISWSTSLLDDSLRARFETLGVFEGPFSVGAAAAVWATGIEDPLTDLKRLCDASLLVARPAKNRPTIYRLLEPIRAVARASLIESGHWDEVVSRHDGHYVTVCRQQRLEMFGDGRVAALRDIEPELAEYLAAWDRIEGGSPEAALPFVWVLGHHWLTTRIGAGYGRMSSLIERIGQQTTVEYADALTISSWVGMYANDWERAVPWADRAVEIYQQAGDLKGLASAHTRRGHWAFGRGDITTAMESLSKSLAICDQIGFEEGKAWPLVLIAQARRWGDDESEEVREMLFAARSLFEATGDYIGQVHTGMVIGSITDQPISDRLASAERMVTAAEALGGDNTQKPTAFHNLAYATWDAGEHERAKGLNRACVRTALASGALITLGLGLLQGARFAGLEGDAERCALLRGAGSAHFAFEITPFQLRYEAPAIEAAKHALGENRYEELFDKGSGLSPEEAAALVLQHA